MAKDQRRYSDIELAEMDEVAERERRMPAQRPARLRWLALIIVALFVAVLVIVQVKYNAG